MWLLQFRSRFFLGRRIDAPQLVVALFLLMGLLFFGIGLFALIDTQHFLQGSDPMNCFKQTVFQQRVHAVAATDVSPRDP